MRWRRTKRHDRLRTVLATKATAAGVSPEIEKMELLERPEELGASEVAGSPFPSEDLQMCTYPTGDLWICRHGPCSHQWYAGLSVCHLCWRPGFGSCKVRDPKKAPHTAQLCAGQGTVHPAGG